MVNEPEPRPPEAGWYSPFSEAVPETANTWHTHTKKITFTSHFAVAIEAPEPKHTAWGQQWGKSCQVSYPVTSAGIVSTFHLKRVAYAFMGEVEEREVGGNAF